MSQLQRPSLQKITGPSNFGLLEKLYRIDEGRSLFHLF